MRNNIDNGNDVVVVDSGMNGIEGFFFFFGVILYSDVFK